MVGEKLGALKAVGHKKAAIFAFYGAILGKKATVRQAMVHCCVPNH